MAPSIRIPDGFVFVPRDAGVAKKLLKAADKIKADRHTSVRTVTGGYHVLSQVAEQYQEEFTSQEPAGGEETAPAKEFELPVSADSSNAEIDEYASGLTPPVDLSGAKNRAEKIEILTAAHNINDQEKE